MKKPERDKAKEAELFPGTSSSTETDVMVSADVLNHRELNTELNHPSFWPSWVTCSLWSIQEKWSTFCHEI